MRFKRKQRIPKRRKNRLKIILKRIVLSSIFIFSIVILFFLGYKFREKIINGKIFPVKFIEIYGNKNVSGKEIIERLKTGRSIFLYTSGRVRKYLSDIDWIDRINVVFDFPDKIILKIKEKYPVFSFNNGRDFYVVTNRKDVIKSDKIFYPVFKNYNEVEEGIKNMLADFLILLKNKKENWYKSIVEVFWDRKDGLTLKMRHFLVKWGKINKKDIVKKFDYLEEVMKDLARRKKFPEYIDLRLTDIKEAIVKSVPHQKNSRR